MKSLAGKAVTVYLAEEKPPLRLEGRIAEAADGLLEVRLARRELSALKSILKRTLRVEVEYVEGRDVWGMPCRLESYGTAFPPVLVLRPAGSARMVHRRRHERYPTNLPARIVSSTVGSHADASGAAETWKDGRLINLSRGGAGFALPLETTRAFTSPFPTGSEVSLQFVAGEMVRPRSRVVRCEEGPDSVVLGLEFLDLTNHDATCLERYLGTLSKH